MEGYLIENPNSPIKIFIKHLIEFREATTRLNTFGFKFIKKFLNLKTNKVHTIFRQCNTTTGRLQSGDKDNGWFNSQNIPAEKKYRECFRTDKDYLIATTDLSGAEAVIMIDKAHDEKFYDMAIVNDDAHSPLCQAVWRAIGEYRKTLYDEVEIEWKEADKLSKINISKKENKNLRTAFKPMTFGTLYGMHDKKTAKTLNISLVEARIALKVIKDMIPKTFAMVEKNAQLAITNGQLVLNSRTNSRIWYPKVIEANKWGTQLSFMDSVEIEGSARNVAIQGTQADMLKEMMVELHNEIIKQNIDACLLGQVHDELLYKFHKKHLEPTLTYIDEKKIETLVNFPDFKKLTMCKVANRYLSYIKMSAEQYVGETWTK
jgi:DNA polymerase-1